MRANILFLFILIVFGCTNSKNENLTVLFPEKKYDNGKYILYDKILTDLNGDNINDSIFLYRIENWNDPGDFHKIIIKFNTGKLIEIYNTGDWEVLDTNESFYETIRKYNLVNNNKVLLVELSKNRKVVIINGYSYASAPGKLTVIDISVNKPKVLFFDNFLIQGIKDLNNDGIKELIGYEYLSMYNGDEEYGGYEDYNSIGETYRPYFVLKFQNESFIIDTLLSESYNYENYVGYFGLEFDKDDRYLVIVPHPVNKDIIESEPYFYFEDYRKYPFTSLRFLNDSDLTKYSKDELRIMRNEIFAFHGYIFDSEDLREHFESLDWYKPKDKNIAPRLNKYEKHNIQLIKELENKN